MLSLYHGAMLSLYYATMLLLYYDAMLLWCHFTMMKVKESQIPGRPAIITKLFNYYKSISYLIFSQNARGLRLKKIAQKIKEKCYGYVNLACGNRFRKVFLNLELTIRLNFLCTFFALPRRAVFFAYNKPAGCFSP